MTRSRFAKKSLGQNFLVDENYVNKIIAVLDLKETDTVIEIGPGRGAITEYLVESGANVIAIELDREFVPMLRERFAANDNFSVVEADAINFDFEQILKGQSPKAKLVANLPYYISTPILQHLSTQRHLFESLVLMFQKEVVDRITARPGDSDRGFLTVLVEAAFGVEKLFDVPPTAFRPVPKVTSSVARFTPKASVIKDEKAFRDLISTAFGQKRKTILNNLKAVYPNAKDSLADSDIDGQRRAETLTLTEWLQLIERLEGFSEQ
ncbi:MAG: 16S rRNA (adenine(1518)-N(6)/adenine(1519)-N(6))-dimethyltransferase RsmA [Pyrinomonadaceae bacterium]